MEGNVHVLPFAVVPAGVERDERPERRVRSADKGAGIGGTGAGKRVDVSDAEHPIREGLDDQIVRFPVRSWARLAERRDRRHHDPRIHAPEVVVPEPERGQVTGRVVLHDDIGAGSGVEERVPIGGHIEIQDDAALAGIELDERKAPLRVLDVTGERACAARFAARRRLDSDHVGAEVGQQARRILARTLGQVQDSKVAQCRRLARHAASLSG